MPEPVPVTDAALLNIYDKNINRCLPAVLQRLFYRFRAQRTIAMQIEKLVKSNMILPLPAVLAKLFPTSSVSAATVTEFKEVSCMQIIK